MTEGNNLEDSLKAASVIQNSFLPSEELMNYLLPESFVLYLPKDHVSGDFYWIKRINDILLFAVADSTGHGAPGSIMRELCKQALDRSVMEFGMVNPGDILEMARDVLVKIIKGQGVSLKEGMDIALCSLEGSQLLFSGANNPLWLVHKNELKVIKGTPQPIGIYDKPIPFEIYDIQLDKGDIIYLFSDGYQDQFGGSNNKKFMVGAFRRLIENIRMKSMPEQRKILEDTLIEWKSEEVQTDDICIMGIRI